MIKTKSQFGLTVNKLLAKDLEVINAALVRKV